MVPCVAFWPLDTTDCNLSKYCVTVCLTRCCNVAYSKYVWHGKRKEMKHVNPQIFMEFEFIAVWRHNQRYFSHICDGTDVQADWRRSCTYGRAPNVIDISQGSLTCLSYTGTGPPFLYGDSDTPPHLVAFYDTLGIRMTYYSWILFSFAWGLLKNFINKKKKPSKSYFL